MALCTLVTPCSASATCRAQLPQVISVTNNSVTGHLAMIVCCFGAKSVTSVTVPCFRTLYARGSGCPEARRAVLYPELHLQLRPGPVRFWCGRHIFDCRPLGGRI